MTERDPIHTYHPPAGPVSPVLSPGEYANAKSVIAEMSQTGLGEQDLLQRDQNLAQIILATNLGIILPDILEQIRSTNKTNPSQG